MRNITIIYEANKRCGFSGIDEPYPELPYFEAGLKEIKTNLLFEEISKITQNKTIINKIKKHSQGKNTIVFPNWNILWIKLKPNMNIKNIDYKFIFQEKPYEFYWYAGFFTLENFIKYLENNE
ncbi:MAG: hypothetical protein ABIL47_07975 [candidate division WOR-3 bacterium]